MPHPAMLALPAAVLAGAMAVATGARPAAAGAPERVELEVAGVLPMPDGGASILVLREKGAKRLLPLVVPEGDVTGSGDVHRGGLLGQAIEALGGRVSEVEIERAEETRSGARVRLAQGSRKVELQARPSESVALALAAGVPIVTRRSLLDEAGLTPEDLERSHRNLKGGDLRL
jgi:bifunctional DNase/RNase